MRTINYIVLHCTATRQEATIKSIKAYWKNVLGWKTVGYHKIIEPNGVIVDLLDMSKVSNGVKGHNSHSIHVSYIGGIDDNGKPIDSRTDAQKVSQIKILKELKIKFPNAIILGHRDFAGVNKACPSFDVKSWLKENNL